MSLRKAVDAYCKSCIHDPLAGLGNWKQQVEGCTVKKCELFEYRLFDRTRPKKPRTEAQVAASVKAGQNLRRLLENSRQN